MNRLSIAVLAALLLVVSCESLYKRHSCIGPLLQCIEDPRVARVTNNPYGVTQRQACEAAQYLLQCVKVCPADFLRSSGLQANIDELASVAKQC